MSWKGVNAIAHYYQEDLWPLWQAPSSLAFVLTPPPQCFVQFAIFGVRRCGRSARHGAMSAEAYANVWGLLSSIRNAKLRFGTRNATCEGGGGDGSWQFLFLTCIHEKKLAVCL